MFSIYVLLIFQLFSPTEDDSDKNWKRRVLAHRLESLIAFCFVLMVIIALCIGLGGKRMCFCYSLNPIYLSKAFLKCRSVCRVEYKNHLFYAALERKNTYWLWPHDFYSNNNWRSISTDEEMLFKLHIAMLCFSSF